MGGCPRKAGAGPLGRISIHQRQGKIGRSRRAMPKVIFPLRRGRRRKGSVQPEIFDDSPRGAGGMRFLLPAPGECFKGGLLEGEQNSFRAPRREVWETESLKLRIRSVPGMEDICMEAWKTESLKQYLLKWLSLSLGARLAGSAENAVVCGRSASWQEKAICNDMARCVLQFIPAMIPDGKLTNGTICVSLPS